MIGDADPDRYMKAFDILQDDENTDIILVLLTPQNMTRPLEVAERLAAAHKGKKPLLDRLHRRQPGRTGPRTPHGPQHPQLLRPGPGGRRGQGHVRLRGLAAAARRGSWPVSR